MAALVAEDFVASSSSSSHVIAVPMDEQRLTSGLTADPPTTRRRSPRRDEPAERSHADALSGWQTQETEEEEDEEEEEETNYEHESARDKRYVPSLGAVRGRHDVAETRDRTLTSEVERNDALTDKMAAMRVVENDGEENGDVEEEKRDVEEEEEDRRSVHRVPSRSDADVRRKSSSGNVQIRVAENEVSGDDDEGGGNEEDGNDEFYDDDVDANVEKCAGVVDGGYLGGDANSMRARHRFSSTSLASDVTKQSSTSDALTRADFIVMECIRDDAHVLDLALKRLPVLPESASKIGTHVTHLYLNGNKLKSLPADFFSLMQTMEYLDLRDNLLVELPAGKPLANHKALKAILLQNNQLRSLPMELGNILTLSTLSFSGNPLTFPPPEVILYGCKAILLYLQECWYSSLLEPRQEMPANQEDRLEGRDENDEAGSQRGDDAAADDDDAIFETRRSLTPDHRNDDDRITAENRRRVQSAVVTPPSAGGRRRSVTPSRGGHARQPLPPHQQQQQNVAEVSFPINKTQMSLQRQKSYGEFKAELFSKLERAGVPMSRRPSSRCGSDGGGVGGGGGKKGGGGGGGGVGDSGRRGMGWKPAGPDYDPDAKEKESPEYFARLAKDPKTRLRGTRTTSRRVAPDEHQPEFPTSASSTSGRQPAGWRRREDPTIDLTTVNAKAVADRRRAIEKEKAEKTEKMLQRQRSTAVLQQWRDEEKLKEMKSRFSQRQPQHQRAQLQQQNSLLRRQRAEKTPFEIDPDLKMETKREKMLRDVKSKHLQQLTTTKTAVESSPDGYERLLAARISEDRNLHRKIHEHKRRIEAQRLKGTGAGGKSQDTQQHLLDAQQQLAEALELQQQVRQARGTQNALELQHGRTFVSKI